VYTCDMSNVLDLKNPPEASAEDTTDVVTPVEALTVARSDSANDLNELAALALSATAAPRTIQWEAYHPLTGNARRNHLILLGAIVGAGALIALWQSSITVFLVALVGAGALEARERWSKPTRVSVDQHGIAIDGSNRQHADFASFDIHRMPDDTVELSLHTTKWHSPHLRLPLGEQNPDDVRAVLTQYIPEGRHAIPFLDYLIRKP
jgi:hypothetical protein